MDFTQLAIQAGIALLGVVLYLIAWRSVAALPALAKWGLRLLLAVVIIAPFALIVLTPTMQMNREVAERAERRNDWAARRYQREADDFSERSSGGNGGASAPVETEKKSRPPAPVAGGSQPEPDGVRPEMKPPSNGGTRGIGANRDPGATTGQPARPTATPRPPAVGQTPDENAAGSARDRTAVEEVAPRAPETTPPGPAKPQSAERLERAQPPSAAPDAASRDLAPGASSPGAVAADQQEDWTVVPVFFGTDRERAANDKRLDFGTARGRKLELGRALVSVPKAHEVPLIERPWSITIPYFKVKIYEQQEDPKKHFIMQELKTLSEAELLALVKDQLAKSARFKDHAFVFVHGYNTSFDFAVYRAAQISYDIKFDGASFVYSWPSGGGIASYTYDRESAAQAEPFFADFLKLVTQKSGAKSISVIAHSMGNQLLLRVLQDMHRQKPEGVQISQIILAAPDVDRDSFENIAASLKGMPSGGITLYAAANDRALDVSRRFHGGIPRAGDVPGGVPLVLPGIDTIDATAVSMDSLGLHHSGYAESNALLSDIGLLIQTGERPPGKRVPILQRVPTEKGEFWRYPAAR